MDSLSKFLIWTRLEYQNLLRFQVEKLEFLKGKRIEDFIFNLFFVYKKIYIIL